VDNAVSERSGGTTRLGSFEIVRKLARGGMAEIFLARTRGPQGFEKLVVLKKILPRYAGNRRFVQLFLDEAKLAASLDHPNIAQVYDIGTVDGSYFFTMEYLHGQDVRSILHRTWRTGERFPIAHAVQIARHVASALHFAHEKQRADGTLLGIVHRDVSPSNIIVTYDGATKLLDFGVAKTTASTVKTRTGALKGKVAYMSPEQARGAPIDRRSDIFALGIVLWEMVTTQRLYRGDNDLATLQQIITQPPRRPTALRPDCPRELERIVLHALADDPDARYSTAEQLVTDLDELAREHKLKQSSNALAATLGQLFGDELAAWREARAAGVPLADHLHDTGDTTTPVSDSDFIELDDEVDDFELDDDDDLTEHAAPIVEPLPALGVDRLSATTIDPAGSASIDPLSSTVLDPAVPPVTEPVTEPVNEPMNGPVNGPVIEPLQTVLDALPPELDTTVLSPVTMRGHPTPATSFAAPTRRHPTPGVPFPAAGSHAAPSAPFAPAGSHATPSAPFPAVGSRAASSMPLAAIAPQPVSSAPFTVPPWQSGQPASLPGGPGGADGADASRVARSWAVVALPPFDPALFDRQRRIVLRISGALVGVIIVLALIAGRC
jgi:serine/threonine protein kinase